MKEYMQKSLPNTKKPMWTQQKSETTEILWKKRPPQAAMST